MGNGNWIPGLGGLSPGEIGDSIGAAGSEIGAVVDPTRTASDATESFLRIGVGSGLAPGPTNGLGASLPTDITDVATGEDPPGYELTDSAERSADATTDAAASAGAAAADAAGTSFDISLDIVDGLLDALDGAADVVLPDYVPDWIGLDDVLVVSVLAVLAYLFGQLLSFNLGGGSGA